jgi:hypothetical protein
VVRLSIGIEDKEDIIADLEQALAACSVHTTTLSSPSLDRAIQ